VCIGQSVDEAVDFAMSLGPAGEIIRLAGEEGQKRARDVQEALTELTTAMSGQRLMGSSSWLISARRP
jgi:hypothetical protein